MDTKKCPVCGEIKTLDQYYKRHNRTGSQVWPRCKICHGIECRRISQKYVAEGRCYCGRPVRPGVRKCEACIANAIKVQKRRKARHKATGLCYVCGKNPTNGYWACEACSARNVVRYHGARMADRKRLFESQGGICPLCAKPLNGYIRKKDAVIDHDHETKKVRGLVHNNCNLNLSNSTIESLERALAYLRGQA